MYNNYNQQGYSNHPPGQQPQPGPGGVAAGQGPDYLQQFQHVSPAMLNYGLHAGQDIINRQKDRWMPGVSTFWFSLKYYFSVSNTYVVAKIYRILYPPAHKDWLRLQADEYERDGEVSLSTTEAAIATPVSALLVPADDSIGGGVNFRTTSEVDSYSRKYALPRQDQNAPDLYIPLMSFMTYVLLYALGRGLSSSSFTPEIIIQAIWRSLLLQAVETALIKFGVNLLSVSIPFLDIFAYTGYKYVGMSINTVARVLGGSLHFLVCLFTSSMLAYFVLKTLAAVVPPVVATGPPRHLLLLGFAGMQFVIIMVLSWL